MKGLYRGCAWLLFLVLLLLVVPAGGAQAAEKATASYTAPDGIVITSFSPHWSDQSKLKELHEELLQNEHGEEIKLLHEVVIYDDYPRGKGVAGQYIFQTIGTVFSAKQKMQPGRIELYGGHDHDTVGSLAHTLAHEYGHHVTHYYTLQTDGFTLTDDKRWSQTSYARLRGLSNDNRVAVGQVDHRWQIAEIAAEDYVQLFGSKLSKAETNFASRVDQALHGAEPATMSWNASMYNVQPQENLTLPLASDVPNLYEFFHKQMKGDGAKFAPPAKPKLNLATYSKQGEAGYQLKFTWDEAGEKDNYTYTLVTYGGNDLLAEPIVTKKAGDAKEARYGAVVVQKGSYIYTYQEPSAKGVRHFKLFAFGDNGWVTESQELTVDMANPSQVTVNDLKVVPVPLDKSAQSSDMNFDFTVLDMDIDLGWLAKIIEWVADFVQSLTSWVSNLL
jgi:hypothetical protein